MSREEKKLAKYENDLNNFSVAGNSKITYGCVTSRPCKDILCLIIFLIFIGSMIVATIVGLKYGQIKKYMAPLDSKDNFCGYSVGYEATHKLYFTNLFGDPTQILKSGVCASACPK